MALKKVTTSPTATPRKLTIPVKPGKAVLAAPVPDAKVKAGTSSRQPRVVHEVTSLYVGGPSKGFTANKSRTPFKHDLFNTQPDRTLTERTLSEAEALKRHYGANPFRRGNLDAGIANALLAKGFMQPVNGEPTSEDATYRFTKPALETKFV